MLYYLFEYINQHIDLPGSGLFKYISFRAGGALIFSLIISILYGNRIINFLRRKQIGETVRDLGLAGQKEKTGTPTMGGIIIILAILIPCLLWARLDNVYILLMLFVTIWLSLIGFLDDYIKVFQKNKEGLKAKTKLAGQVICGLVVAPVSYTHLDVYKRQYVIFLVFVLAGFVILGRVAQIGIIEGDKWRSRGDSLYVKYQPVEAERGNILSSDGRLLVTSLPLFDVRIDLLASKRDLFVSNLDSLALCLSRYVNPAVSERAFRDLLWRERQAGNRYLMIKDDVTYAQMELIKTFPLFRMGQHKSGLIIVKRSRRERPYRMLASRTLGSVREGANPVGLEGAYNKVLAGETGSRLVQKVAKDIWVPVDDIGDYEPERGQDIKTHIDIDIQDITEQALYKACLLYTSRCV